MNLKKFGLIMTAVLLLAACKKDDPVEILSLSKNGSHYYFG